MRRLFALGLLALPLSACGLHYTPPAVPPVAQDGPCYDNETTCVTAKGSCCGGDQDCGGDFPGCPAGVCCANGTTPYDELGARRQTPMRRHPERAKSR